VTQIAEPNVSNSFICMVCLMSCRGLRRDVELPAGTRRELNPLLL
jgi:hypothetical protein